MANNHNLDGRRLRFSLREALAATIIVALGIGWYASTQRAEREIARLTRQLRFVDAYTQWSESHARISKKVRTASKTDRLLYGFDLSGANLRGVKIVGQATAFQGTIFNDCDLRDANLTGSFQKSSFVDADLSGATLIGGGSSFQGANLQGATLIGARIVCSGASFQAVNIDAANFRQADLSTIEAESLKSCYFKTPPTYDDWTRFPKNFDASLEGWKRAE